MHPSKGVPQGAPFLFLHKGGKPMPPISRSRPFAKRREPGSRPGPGGGIPRLQGMATQPMRSSRMIVGRGAQAWATKTRPRGCPFLPLPARPSYPRLLPARLRLLPARLRLLLARLRLLPARLRLLLARLRLLPARLRLLPARLRLLPALEGPLPPRFLIFARSPAIATSSGTVPTRRSVVPTRRSVVPTRRKLVPTRRKLVPTRPWARAPCRYA
jgi:hypothetical protein